MSPRPATKVDVAEMSRLIRREVGMEVNVRLLQRMPIFKADYDLPEDMQQMLVRLEEAERESAE